MPGTEQVDFNWYLLLTAAMLGFRHGMDWDHVAAITDITAGQVFAGVPLRRAQLLGMPALYAVGHLMAIALLALIARFVVGQMPSWLDAIMEKIVGITLIAMGIWLASGIVTNAARLRPVTLLSRWSMLGAALRKLSGREPAQPAATRTYASKAVVGLGALHGIGAETGTQVVLLAAVSGGNVLAAGGLLLAFSCGLLSSSVALGGVIGAGLLTTSQRQLIITIVGILGAAFSVAVGVSLCTGGAEGLPSITSRLWWQC